MARDSCVLHPPGDYFVAVRKSYVTLLKDHCAAALLSVFEYLTNGEIERSKAAKNDALVPWVTATLSYMTECLVDLYSENSVRKALKALVDGGFLEVSASPGEANLYRLDYQKLNQELTPTKFVTPPKTIGVPPQKDNHPPTKNDRGTPTKIEGLYKEEESDKNLRREEEDPSVSPQALSSEKTKESEDLLDFDDVLLLRKNCKGPAPSASNRNTAAAMWPPGTTVSRSMAERVVAAEQDLVKIITELSKLADFELVPVARNGQRRTTYSSGQRATTYNPPPPRRRVEVIHTAPWPESERWNTEVPNCPPYVVQIAEDEISLQEFRKQPNCSEIMDECYPICNQLGDCSFPFFMNNWPKIKNGIFCYKMPKDKPDKPRYESREDRKRNAREIARREMEENLKKSQETQDAKHT